MRIIAPVLNQWLRWVEKPRMARTQDPEALRRVFRWQAKLMFHAPWGTGFKWRALPGAAGIETLEVTPKTQTAPGVVLYIHGGGFVFGSPDTHSAMMGQLAKRLGAKVFLPRYRLSPEHAFPAAVSDVRAAWDGLRAADYPAGQTVLGGDSAGGALALGLLADLCRDPAMVPAGVFCFSPLTDLRYCNPSIAQNKDADVVLPAERAHETAENYLQGADAEDPAASPIFADFTGACPVWLTVGDTEILRDDSHEMGKRLRANDVAVTLIEQGEKQNTPAGTIAGSRQR